MKRLPHRSTSKPVCCRVFMFAPRFVGPIRLGTKTQTIRGNSARTAVIRPGDLACLRRWSGKAYRSKQDEIVPARPIRSVEPIAVGGDWSRAELVITIAGDLVAPEELEPFVRADGFDSVADFCGHWSTKYRNPFAGVLIRWEPLA